ncbi:ComEC/Rec2 family competence protein [Paenibacillus spongiae]|uniref:MBL fold metallo-hydrolase n=1 Tax=Paenibacillus spongiae TaxID=2909671 RepID=A0ABY5S458_9BACL|nr:MBL fold metallo-hydrolase [Paenibacillus spongiae]UVI27513.1 MBL fold metallo-hydrolase [Paenibacillus spongiae]
MYSDSAEKGTVHIKLFDVNTPETDQLGFPHGNPADSFLIRIQEEGEERRILLDGAKQGQGKHVIIPYLIENGITTLDCIILSHAHNDHFGGIIDILEDPRFTVHQFIYSPLDDDIVEQSCDANNYEGWLTLRKLVGQLPNVLELNETHIGTELRFGSEARFEIVSTPDRDYLRANKQVDLNDFNLIVKLKLGKFSALMAGDCGEYQSRQILNSNQRQSIESVTMLKAAHHGGDASTTPEFIHACGAKLVVIPCNVTVVEHRPSFIQNMHLFSRLGAKLLRADWARNIEVRTDGSRVECIMETDLFNETTLLEL